MIGTILSDRYEITGELGRGGMSVVYAAYDPLLRREVAVKVIAPTYLDRRSEEAIRREAQLVAKLDHPAIVPIHDLGRHGDTLYLVMPRVRGETLRKALDREVGLRLGDVLEIGVQAAQALGYSHSRGVVHRDIKPSNMIIEHLGGSGLRVRILDFGLAVPIAEPSSSEAADEVPGTLSYLAPEQVEQPTGPADGPVDLYALGVVLYECLAGEPPFVGAVYGTLYRIVHEAPAGLLDRGVAIDQELESLVLSCLEKSPGKRPKDGRSLAASLARYRDRLAESQWAHMPAVAIERSAPAQIGNEPLVGRQGELASLREALNQAIGGSSRLVVLGGEAGVGKTRLAAEVERLAAARQVRVLHGHFSDWESAFPYQ
ncbi:MAG: protein kinase, partial [Acidobacteriota bacterium]